MTNPALIIGPVHLEVMHVEPIVHAGDGYRYRVADPDGRHMAFAVTGYWPPADGRVERATLVDHLCATGWRRGRLHLLALLSTRPAAIAHRRPCRRRAARRRPRHQRRGMEAPPRRRPGPHRRARPR